MEAVIQQLPLTRGVSPISDEVADTLRAFGVDPTQAVQQRALVKSRRRTRPTDTTEKIIFSDTNYVGLDENGRVVSLANFKETYLPPDALEQLNNTYMDEEGFERLPAFDDTPYNQVHQTEDIQDLIDLIERKEALTEHRLVESAAWDEDFWNLCWEKEVDGTRNRYDGAKVTISRKDKSVVSLERYDLQPNTWAPEVTEQEALEAAEPIYMGMLSSPDAISQEDIQVELMVVRPNYMWTEGGPYEPAPFVRLAYQVSLMGGALTVDIDAITGENIGGSIAMSETAAVFSYTGFYGASGAATYASQGLSSLGYSVQKAQIGTDLGAGIRSFVNAPSGNNYAVYVRCHGSTSYLTDSTYAWYVYPSNVSGNWHFVFLDACSTAASTVWADAFKINGYTGRGFLGWSGKVLVDNQYEFDSYFWPLVINGMRPREAAVQAAAKVPGSGTTPIKYYGDRSYSGRAYS